MWRRAIRTAWLCLKTQANCEGLTIPQVDIDLYIISSVVVFYQRKNRHI